jgi:hypothetical protein
MLALFILVFVPVCETESNVPWFSGQWIGGAFKKNLNVTRSYSFV